MTVDHTCARRVENDRTASEAATIDTFLDCAQAVPSKVRWLYCREDLSRYLALLQKPVLGPRSRWILAALRTARLIQLDGVVARLWSAAMLYNLLRNARKSQLSRSGREGLCAPTAVFFSIGALRENQALVDFRGRLQTGELLILDQRFPETADWASKVDPKRCWHLWRSCVNAVMQACREGTLVGLPREMVLLSLVRLAHLHAYFQQLFAAIESAHQAGNSNLLVGCVTSSIPAFVACERRHYTIYYQHGFLRRSLAFPDFNEIVSFNAPEAAHLSRRVPRASVVLQQPRLGSLEPRRRLVVVGDYVQRDVEPARSLIEACRANSIDVVVRPHPADTTGNWRIWDGFDGVRVTEGGSLADCLSRERPALVATWISTALFDAAVAGAVPITLSTYTEASDIVFPFHRLAPCWPDDRERILSLVDNPTAYSAALATARHVALGGVV